MLRQPWAGWESRWDSSALWAMMTLPTKCWISSKVIPLLLVANFHQCTEVRLVLA